MKTSIKCDQTAMIIFMFHCIRRGTCYSLIFFLFFFCCCFFLFQWASLSWNLHCIHNQMCTSYTSYRRTTNIIYLFINLVSIYLSPLHHSHFSHNTSHNKSSIICHHWYIKIISLMPITHFSINYQLNYWLNLWCSDHVQNYRATAFCFFFQVILSHTFRYLILFIRSNGWSIIIAQHMRTFSRLDLDWRTCISTISSLTLITLSTKSIHEQKCFHISICINSNIQIKWNQMMFAVNGFEAIQRSDKKCVLKHFVLKMQKYTHHRFWFVIMTSA